MSGGEKVDLKRKALIKMRYSEYFSMLHSVLWIGEGKQTLIIWPSLSKILIDLTSKEGTEAVPTEELNSSCIGTSAGLGF